MLDKPESVASDPVRSAKWDEIAACRGTTPAPMQAWNRYRSLALGLHWQRCGLPVVPTLSWAASDTYGFCFEGIPKHATVAVSTVGIAADEAAKAVFFDGMAEAMRRLEPARVLVYGADVGFDFGGCEVVEIKASIRGS